MRAVLIRRFGDAAVLEMEEVQSPSPGPNEVVVAVEAVAVARTRDVAVRSGRHPYSKQVTLPRILGGDCVGVVTEVGAAVAEALMGLRVAVSAAHACGACAACTAGDPDACTRLSILGVHRNGSYAERVLVPASAVTEIPSDLPAVEAAALAASGPLAFTQLDAAHVRSGTRLLVTGATGSVGTTLIAMANAYGARPVALARRPAAIPKSLDPIVRINSESEDLTEQLKAAGNGTPVTAVVDNVASGAVFGRYFPALGFGARIVISGALGDPPPVVNVPAASLYTRSLALIGVRTARGSAHQAFWDLVADGFRLGPGLTREFPLAEAADAHGLVAAGQHVGHTVLRV